MHLLTLLVIPSLFVFGHPSATLCQLKISTSGQDHQPSNQSVPTALSDQLLAPSQDDILENLEKI